MKHYPVGKELTILFNDLRGVEYRGSMVECMNIEKDTLGIVVSKHGQKFSWSFLNSGL